MCRKQLLEIIVLGSPLVFGLLSEFFMYIADSAMVGRLGTGPLAAIGIGTLVTEILWVMVWPLAPATQAIASRRYGREIAGLKESRGGPRNVACTGEVLDNAIVVALLAGFIAVSIGFSAGSFFHSFLEDEQVIDSALSYVGILKWIMPLGAVFYALYGFLAAVNLTMPIMISSIGINLLNIFFNYILIYGKFGFPALGITGSAIATLVAEVIGTVYLILFVFTSRKITRYGLFTFRRLKVPLIKDIISCATPLACQLVMILSIFLYYETLIANIGTIYLAVTHILFTLLQLKRTLVGGYAEGGAALIGNSLGRGERKEALGYSLGCEVLAVFFGTIVFGCLFFFPEVVVGIFNQDPRTVHLGAWVVKVFAFFLFLEIIGFQFDVIFSHNGWGRFTFFAEISTGVVCILGVTLVCTRVLDLGIYSAWSAFALYMVLHSALLIAGFFSWKWMDIAVEQA